MTNAETFLIRTKGGPHPGDRYCKEGDEWGFGVVAWPLPEKLPDHTGYYRKVSESQLPPQAPDSRVKRGAQYEWVEEDE